VESIGRYRIVGELGRGAMGVVYKAQDPAIGRLIAIKTIRLNELTEASERDRLRDRLFREAQSAGILSHPGIVTIYDIAEQDGMAYIFMELVNGPQLEQMLRAEQPPDKETLLSLFRQIAAALDYAHKKGIVHRDIKPANIMVHEDGTAKVTDFGVAKIVSQQMTQAGTIMGTPSYMSPEQVQGGTISGQTDQFSLAVIAYEVLTGEKPFTADYLPTLLFKIVREEPTPPQRLNATLSSDVETVMRRALSKNPANRYETCSEFVNALAAACNTSGNWVPLPRGASHNMPTAGSQAGLAAALAETIAESAAVNRSANRAGNLNESRDENLDETVAAPLPPPSPPLSAPPTAAESKPEPVPAPVAVVEPAAAVIPPLARPAERAPLVAPSRTGRTVMLALLGGVVVALGIYFFWPAPRSTAPPPPPVVSDTASPSSPPAPTPPAPESTLAPAPAPAVAARIPPQPKTPPSPTEAAFELTTNPAGAEAVFDSKPELRCTTPCSLNLAMGRHTLAIKHQGYREAQRVFSLPNEPGLIVSLEATLGTLSLTTSPAGLTVFIDGQEQARKTPANFPLSVGEHRVQVNRGNEKQDFSVDIRDGVVSQKSIDWGQ
jgi:serine/threonine protein kinase